MLAHIGYPSWWFADGHAESMCFHWGVLVPAGKTVLWNPARGSAGYISRLRNRHIR